MVDLARGRVPGAGALRRVAHAFLLVDTRALVRAPRAVEPRLLGRAALAATIAAMALGLVDWPGTEPLPALRWAAGAAFFALHGALVLGERRLGVSRWRPGLARAWTLSALAATAPLFVEPVLRCL